ncbi:MAG: EVE domain-containing protein [Simkaniaceae bacterium]|nr:MAG: EVE domain-containing protein [Simkaniaceae bacterium]
MQYWLIKSEPTTYSIDDLQRLTQDHWEGVRNYQARNFMRDEMKVGDLALFYHSNTTPPGVVGVAKVCREAHPDFTAWDPESKYFDPKSSPDNPRWMMVDVEFVEKFPRLISLEELRDYPELEAMVLLQKGSRLSVQRATKEEFTFIRKLGLC